MACMTDDAQPLPRGAEHPIYAREAQFLLSLMYTFKEVMSLRNAVIFAILSRKEGNFIPKLVTSKHWDTTIGKLIIGMLVLAILSHSETDGKVLPCISLKKASITQLPRFLIDVVSVTASMQTIRTKWNDGDQIFDNQHILVVVNSSRQSDPLIDTLLLLSNYPTQEGNDLPAMRAWI